MRFFIPIMIFIFTVGIASALALYWLVGGLVAYLQQARVLGQDEVEMEGVTEKTSQKEVIEGEVISKPKPKTSKNKPKKTSKNKRKK